MSAISITHALVLAGLGVSLLGLAAFLAVSGHFFSRFVAWVSSRRPAKVRPPWATTYRKPPP